MQCTMDKIEQLLGCIICYRALDMILNIHSDASYLSEANAKNQALGQFN